MSSHPRRFAAAALLAAALVSACGQATAASSHSTRTQIGRLTAAAQALYAHEVSGTHSLAVLHRVGSDPRLLSLLRSRRLAAARGYVGRQFPRVWYHWHVSRMRITQGSHLVTEIGVPYVVPPSTMVLRSAGHTVGKLFVSMQDEIGFVRLEHRRYPVQVLLRGRTPSLLRTSLHAAALVRLPARGQVRIGGTAYQVRSFQEQSWEDGPVTIWILMRG
jgi:hypothetical protein